MFKENQNRNQISRLKSIYTTQSLQIVKYLQVVYWLPNENSGPSAAYKN